MTHYARKYSDAARKQYEDAIDLVMRMYETKHAMRAVVTKACAILLFGVVSALVLSALLTGHNVMAALFTVLGAGLGVVCERLDMPLALYFDRAYRAAVGDKSLLLRTALKKLAEAEEYTLCVPTDKLDEVRAHIRRSSMALYMENTDAVNAFLAARPIVTLLGNVITINNPPEMAS